MPMGHQEKADKVFESGADFEDWFVQALEAYRRGGFQVTLANIGASYSVVFHSGTGWKIRIMLLDGGVAHAWRIIADHIDAGTTGRTVKNLLPRLSDGSILIDVPTSGQRVKAYFHEGERYP